MPLVHYLVSGAPRGKDPSLRFNSTKYLEYNPGLIGSGVNPLAHFLLYGKSEDLYKYSRFTSASPEKILGLLNSANQDYPSLPESVDIIIPVFNGMRHLPSLFDGIFANTAAPHRFVITDDASTDPEVWPYLKARTAGRSDCVLLRNSENLGFCRTVNRAATQCGGHFVLLNTDTVVPQHWLERLMRPIFELGNAASTTPFSNSATIFSFPLPDADNLMLASDVDTVDHAFRKLRQDIGPDNDTPTGVGFCMGVNGDLWRRIGGFDPDAFGSGYGEENDWCQRAISHGYRNILVHNLFVAHFHGGSFDAETKKALASKNIKIIKKRWPNYLPSIEEHVRKDRWSNYRHAAFLAFCLSPSLRPMMIMDAERGGGANHYSERIANNALAESRSIVSLRFDANIRSIKAWAAYRDFGINFILTEAEILSMLPMGRAETILVNELASWRSPESILEIAVKLKSGWSAHLEFALHDFLPICPTAHLLDGNGNYCRLPAESACRQCLPKNKHSIGKRTDIGEWRGCWRAFFASVDKIRCFSRSSFESMCEVYPEISTKAEIRPHEPLAAFAPGSYRTRRKHPLTIGVVGHIARYKGSEIVRDLARLLSKRRIQARIVVIGKLTPECNERNVKVTGAYLREDLPALLNQHNVDVVLFPSIIPETFSYVTQEIISLGCPIVCFDLGGQAEQVRNYDSGRIASAMTAESALDAIEELMSNKAHNHIG
jgi:GT2 family glycosyltransferase